VVVRWISFITIGFNSWRFLSRLWLHTTLARFHKSCNYTKRSGRTFCVSAKRRLRWGVVPFLVVDLPSPYNKIIWQPTLTSLGAVISIDCVSMNFLHKEASVSRLEIRILKNKSQLRRYHKRRKSEESWNRYAWIAHGGRWCKITCREAEKDTFVQRE